MSKRIPSFCSLLLIAGIAGCHASSEGGDNAPSNPNPKQETPGQNPANPNGDSTPPSTHISFRDQVVLKHDDTVLSLAFSKDGTQLASGSTSNTAILWDLAHNNAMIRQFDNDETTTTETFGNGINGLDFNDDGSQLVTANRLGYIKQFATQDASISSTIFHDSSYEIFAAKYFKNSEFIATCDGGLVIRKNTADFPIVASNATSCKSLSVSTDGKTIATSGDGLTASIWVFQDGNLTETVLKDTLLNQSKTAADITMISLSPDGKKAVTSENQAVILWDLEANPPKESVVLDPTKVDLKTIQSLAFSPDGTYFAKGDVNGTVVLYDAKDGQTRGSVGSNLQSMMALAFSSDGKKIAAGGSSIEHNTVYIWTLEHD